MTIVRLVLGAGWRDLARSRWLIAYALGFFLVGEGLFWFGGTGPQVVLSQLNIALMVVPLVALVFGTMHVYASREFVQLLLAQPVPRGPLFTGLYLGLALPLTGAFVLSAGLPFALHGGAGVGAGALTAFAVSGVALTFAFAGIATWIAWSVDDRLRGVGAALGVWFGTTVLYDGLVLAMTVAFADWPLERVLLALMVANPVDLARLVVLGQLDVSALMGYTGALFNRALGTTLGAVVATLALTIWCAGPYLASARQFRRRDF